jgi:SNF2 family DNA or RNA helicase
VVTRTQYRYRAIYGAVPGGEWSRERAAWVYPLTVMAARALREILGAHYMAPEILALIEQDDALTSAQASGDAPECLSKTELWDHQREAFALAFHKPAAMLAMDMGCGKSAVAVALVCTHRAHRTLVICPLSVIGVWPRQFALHGALAYNVLTLDDRYRSVALKAAALKTALDSSFGLVAVVNYESVWREPMNKLLLKQQWDYVILDESHRIKSPTGVASRFIAKLRDRATRRLCLTGTPMPHSPLDIFGQYRFLDPSIYGTSFTLFRANYAVMGGYNNYEVVRYQHMAEFNHRFYAIAYRVMADDVQSLPEQVFTERYCTLSERARKLYNDLDRDFYAAVASGEVTAGNALTKLLRLQQLTSGYLVTDEGEQVPVDDSKLKALREVLEDIPPEEPVVIFCRFTRDVQAIKALCETLERPPAELSGHLKELEVWQHGERNALVAQINAGGLGIDATRARHQIYFSLGFSLGDYEQSLKRIHRPGQTRKVLYTLLLAEGTVDERVRDALMARREVIQFVLQKGLS